MFMTSADDINLVDLISGYDFAGLEHEELNWLLYFDISN